ncbi:Transcription elongation factor 1 [Tetrabaena socialis]|uniref:Transcription elongation factor 1 homolog n=1 Tax=Tetrabaena socialis TaxID=47790 RepID=A0A2J8AGY4_9CHLO|nr:Transcription elongation factor 1 [Tetrabaena socialis]|eukprot:PNH11783.1 Transcription elongation factor 1 [Tetrabaena socialis]
MGKRKSRKPGEAAALSARKKARTTLPSRFECPFCNVHGTVAVTLQRDEGRASAECQECGMRYATHCRTLTEPVDVYHEWIDACEDAVQAPPPRAAITPAVRQAAATPRDQAERQPVLHRLRRGPLSPAAAAAAAQVEAETEGTRGEGAQPGSPRALLAGADGARRRLKLAEGLQETMRAGLEAGATLHDPAAAALLAARTMGGAAASAALPPGSSVLRRQRLAQPHQQQQPQRDLPGEAQAHKGAEGADAGAPRRMTEAQRQQAAAREFGAYD